MTRIGVCLLSLVLAALPAAGEDKKPEKADVRGRITAVMPAKEDARKTGFLGTIRVEGKKEATTGYDKAIVQVTSKTRITMRFGAEKKFWGFEDLKKGRKVQVIFAGGVAESKPVQATAKEIVVLEEAK